MKYSICETCGNLVEHVKESGVPMICCGAAMIELEPGTSDGAAEKHVPVVTVDGNKVSVQIGSLPHPMIPEHYIQWIAIETKKGCQKVNLTSDNEPRATFCLSEGDEVVAAYAYCNIHSLWKSN